MYGASEVLQAMVRGLSNLGPSHGGCLLNVPYLSILKLGLSTCRGSNIHQVVQQNERNQHLGPFKCRVPKLFNLINLKMVPDIKEN